MYVCLCVCVILRMFASPSSSPCLPLFSSSPLSRTCVCVRPNDNDAREPSKRSQFPKEKPPQWEECPRQAHTRSLLKAPCIGSSRHTTAKRHERGVSVFCLSPFYSFFSLHSSLFSLSSLHIYTYTYTYIYLCVRACLCYCVFADSAAFVTLPSSRSLHARRMTPPTPTPPFHPSFIHSLLLVCRLKCRFAFPFGEFALPTHTHTDVRPTHARSLLETTATKQSKTSIVMLDSVPSPSLLLFFVCFPPRVCLWYHHCEHLFYTAIGFKCLSTANERTAKVRTALVARDALSLRFVKPPSPPAHTAPREAPCSSSPFPWWCGKPHCQPRRPASPVPLPFSRTTSSSVAVGRIAVQVPLFGILPLPDVLTSFFFPLCLHSLTLTPPRLSLSSLLAFSLSLSVSCLRFHFIVYSRTRAFDVSFCFPSPSSPSVSHTHSLFCPSLSVRHTNPPIALLPCPPPSLKGLGLPQTLAVRGGGG